MTRSTASPRGPAIIWPSHSTSKSCCRSFEYGCLDKECPSARQDRRHRNPVVAGGDLSAIPLRLSRLLPGVAQATLEPGESTLWLRNALPVAGSGPPRQAGTSAAVVVPDRAGQRALPRSPILSCDPREGLASLAHLSLVESVGGRLRGWRRIVFA